MTDQNFSPYVGNSVDDLAAEYARIMGQAAPQPQAPAQTSTAKTRNTFEPQTLDEYQGQDRIKAKVKKYITATMLNDEPLMHTSLVAKSGQGKSTLARIIANEMGVDVYWEAAPMARERLLELSAIMKDGDILVIDEIHLQAKGRSASLDPAILYSVMQDFEIVTLNQGKVDYPRITVMGATTDEGLLPVSLKERFKLKLTFDEYTDKDLAGIAKLNATQSSVDITDEAALKIARGSLGVPREVNNLMAHAVSLSKAIAGKGAKAIIDAPLAEEILEDDGREHDGLKRDMMLYMTELWERRKYIQARQEWVAQCSLGTIAHCIGRAQDKKAVENDIEPVLIRRGYVDITTNGRALTEKGLQRIGKQFPSTPPAKGAKTA